MGSEMCIRDSILRDKKEIIVLIIPGEVSRERSEGSSSMIKSSKDLLLMVVYNCMTLTIKLMAI